MESTEKYLYHYKKLKGLLDEDMNGISQCIDGEMLEQYREMLKREADVLKKRETHCK